MEDLLMEVPVIHNTKELSQYLRPMYILSDYLKSDDDYKVFRERLYTIIKGCFTIKECREHPIKFKFNVKEKETHTMEFRHFIVNTILWYPFVELYDTDAFDSSFIIDCNKDIPKVGNYINEKLIPVMRDYHIKSTKTNFYISEVLYNLRKISEDFSIIMGLNFSIPMFVDIYNSSDEIKDIMECTFDDNLQPHEIEAQLQALQDRFVGLIKDMPDNHLGVVLRSGTGVKTKQLAEFAISEGLKPTLTGDIRLCSFAA